MLQEWIERHVDRRAARQQSQVETAKLLSTLAITLAATLLASALQAGKSRPLGIAGSTFLATAFLGVLIVILLDRTTEVDQEAVLKYGSTLEWSGQEAVDHLRTAVYLSARNNEAVVSAVKIAAQIQVALSVLAAICAVASLLQ